MREIKREKSDREINLQAKCNLRAAQHDGLGARGAHLVDGGAHCGKRQTCGKRRLARFKTMTRETQNTCFDGGLASGGLSLTSAQNIAKEGFADLIRPNAWRRG